jgi:plastocyanin
MKRTALALLVLPFALAPATPAYAGGGCFPGGPAALAETHTIVIDHACFGTGAAHVAAGAVVTWRNTSGLDHNISGPGVDYAELPAGATHTVTFATPGLYPYACTIHPGMSGVVVVGPAAALKAPVAAPVAAPATQPPAAAQVIAEKKASSSSSSLGLLGALAAVVLSVAVVLVGVGRRSPHPAG